MALGDDRAMMPREGCLCQFISLLRQNQSPKIQCEIAARAPPRQGGERIARMVFIEAKVLPPLFHLIFFI